MNYRHAFHAGNFADVLKHVLLSRVVTHLREKSAAFRAIDTHSGPGLYDLTGAEANRTGEFHNGIERLIGARLDETSRRLFAPYLEAIALHNPAGGLTSYPG